MHPALSVIIFTVSSGAGFGLLALMGFASLAEARPSTASLLITFGIAFVLCAGGLISSTFHLGHPERAWRALTQWRSSWLSREGVLAVVALIVNAIHAGLWIISGDPFLLPGLFGAVLALLTVYATGMIYAQIKAVDLWHRKLTPLCYLAFSLASGVLLFVAVHVVFSGYIGWFMASVGLVALVIAWALKLFWWLGANRAPLSTPESATGLGRFGKTRLLESPHTGENYLMREMGFRIARKHAIKLRLLALLLGAVVPIVLILIALPAPFDLLWMALAVIAHFIGMFAERWLFFAEARHAVMAYYR